MTLVATRGTDNPKTLSTHNIFRFGGRGGKFRIAKGGGFVAENMKKRGSTGIESTIGVGISCKSERKKNGLEFSEISRQDRQS